MVSFFSSFAFFSLANLSSSSLISFGVLARRSYFKGIVLRTTIAKVVYMNTMMMCSSHRVLDFADLSMYHYEIVPFLHSKPN